LYYIFFRNTTKQGEVAMKRKQKKVFVLDTNVYIHDPNALFTFTDHDIYVPMGVMRELDKLKNQKVNIRPESAKNARVIARFFDELIHEASPEDVKKGFPISNARSHYGKEGALEKTGKVFFETVNAKILSSTSYMDGVIINFVSELQKTLAGKAEVVFVTQDINARITALMCGIQTQEYISGKALDDIDLLYSGMFELPADFWHTAKIITSSEENGFTYRRVTTPLAKLWFPNQFLYLEKENGETEEYIVQNIVGENATIRTVIDYRKVKNGIWGIYPQNKEQNFFLNALMDPNIKLVTGAGKAGSGKTLLTLASALEQVVELPKVYKEIIITRESMPMGEDIGFLPGNEEQKLMPWMAAFTDNLDFLTSDMGDGVHRVSATDLMKRSIKMRSISFMKGRTFHEKFLIIDEVQDLTKRQVKNLATRAGPGTKIVALGNVAQIDTQYLTAEASGLTHLVETFKSWDFAAHVTLVQGERSPLADFAADNL
jgi:PhoH-like ATPase